MTARAIRFTGAGVGTDADANMGAGAGDAGAAGLAVTAAGAIATVDGDAAVRQALVLLLSTRPGERLMRPQYGSYLHRLLFAPNDGTTAGLAIHYVRQAIERWEPRVEIVDVDATPDPYEPTRLLVSLTYRVRTSLAVERLEYPIDLQS